MGPLLPFVFALSAAGAADVGSTESFDELVEAGHWPQALEVARQRAEQTEASGVRSVEYAAALRDLGAAHNLMMQADDAVRALEAALEIQREHLGAEHPEVATTLNELAWAARGQDRHDEAVTLAEEALRIRRKHFGEDAAETVESFYWYVAVRVLSSTPYPEQEALAREMVTKVERTHGELSLEATEAWVVLRGLLSALGELDEAMILSRKLLVTRRDLLGSEHPLVADAKIALAASAWRRGDYAEAEGLLREGLDVKRRMLGEDSQAAFAAHAFLATVLTSAGKSDEALVALREAVDSARRLYGDAHGNLYAVLNNYGLQLYNLRRFEEAEPVLREALAIQTEIELKLGFARRTLASTLMELGQLDEAQSIYETDLAEHLRHHGESNTSVYVIRAFLGTLAGLRGDWEEAEVRALAAAGSYETMRLKAGRGVERATYFKSPYETLAIARANLGRGTAAWQAIEHTRGRVLHDLLERAAVWSLNDLDRAEQDSLRNRWVACSDRVARLRVGETVPADSLESAENDLLIARNAWDRSQRALDSRYVAGSDPIADLETVRSALDPGEAVIGWVENPLFQGPADVWGYVVRRSGPVQWRRMFTADRGTLVRTREELNHRLTGGESTALGPQLMEIDSQLTSRLWRERFEPMLDLLDDVDHIIAVPSSFTAGLPLELATDGSGVRLGERFLVSYAPSATTYSRLRGRADAESPRFAQGLIVADPPTRPEHLIDPSEPSTEAAVALARIEPGIVRSALDGHRESLELLPRLRWSRHESDAIIARFPDSAALTGVEASAASLRRLASAGRLREFDFLHFATHALVDPDSPDDSAVVLSQVGAESDVLTGLLTGEEISRDWSIDARLVTLSACETALGRRVSGEGVIGLAYPFLQVGARCLLLTLWNVDDRATALLMGHFYESWAQGSSKVAALHQAKEWLREYEEPDGWRPYEHPYYWSAFVLIGDAS